MKRLLKKELTLAHPIIYLFASLSMLLVVPVYPSLIAMNYTVIAILSAFSTFAAYRDLEFTSSLPISRKEIVLSKHLLVAFMQAMQIVFAIPFAIFSLLVSNEGGNPLGLDTNLAFFGEVLILYGVFNVVFFPLFFRTGEKAGIPILFAFLGVVVLGCTMELLIALVPALHTAFDGIALATLGFRIGMFVVGLGIYVACFWLSLKLSVKKFERVSL